MPRARRHFWIALSLLGCLIWFVDRGPYRAIRYSTTGDFSTVYAAARCWFHGSNPYDRTALKHELAVVGAAPDLQQDQEINPSVYLPSALPWIASIAWLPWDQANTLWCLLLVAAFGTSLAVLVAGTPIARDRKWLILCAALLFSPTYVGVYDGNPSVLVIALITLAICGIPKASTEPLNGLLLGVAFCFKPQLAFAALCTYVIWKRWRPLIVAAAVFFVSLAIGIVIASHFGQSWQWVATLQHNLAASFEPGGQSDPASGSIVGWQLLNAQTLVAYLVPDRRWWSAIVWLIAAFLAGIYLNRRRGRRSLWQDASFFSALTLLVTYHRYYDAQLLLVLIPLLVQLWKGRVWSVALAVAVCLMLLAMPWQSLFASRLGAAAIVGSRLQFLLLRHQPVAVLAIAVVLALCRPADRWEEIETPAPAAS